MVQNSKNKNTLKNLPFYSEEIEKSEKKDKKTSNIELLLELPFSLKNIKNCLIFSYQKNYHFFQKNLKERKSLKN